MKKILETISDTERFAGEFLRVVLTKNRNVILLQGELGVGKTAFSQFFLRELGAKGPFTSPTFVIMKKYSINSAINQKKNANPFPSLGKNTISSIDKELLNGRYRNIYHFDCYRVGEEDILDLGWREIIADKGNLVLVEWPEKIKNIWPEKYWLLKFEYGTNKQVRTVNLVSEQEV